MTYGGVVLAMVALLSGGVGIGGCATDGQKKEEKIQDAEWHYKMGKGYFDNHQIYPAIRELKKAVEMDPKMAQAHFVLGLIYSGRRKYTDAIQHYKEALRIDPKFFTAKNNLGSVYLAMERWRDAKELFQDLIEESLYPTPEMAHNNLGWAFYNLREYERALEHFKMAIFLKPQMCLAYNNVGLTHRAMGNTSKAIDGFEKAIKKCPTNYAEPHFNMGKILQEQGNHGQARHHFERCSDILPDANLGERCREYLQVR